jgi:hypothetical protein
MMVCRMVVSALRDKTSISSQRLTLTTDMDPSNPAAALPSVDLLKDALAAVHRTGQMLVSFGSDPQFASVAGVGRGVELPRLASRKGAASPLVSEASSQLRGGSIAEVLRDVSESPPDEAVGFVPSPLNHVDGVSGLDVSCGDSMFGGTDDWRSVSTSADPWAALENVRFFGRYNMHGFGGCSPVLVSRHVRACACCRVAASALALGS